MQPRIELLKEMKLVGQKLQMSMANNRTGQLWSGFAPRIHEIPNRMSTTEKISLQVYHPSYFSDFNPNAEFEKWATVEVMDFDAFPTGMESFTLHGGLYAVFDYKGSSTDNRVFQYIFQEWLPNSDYELDDRPHFEVLGERYKNGDPNSEEEIWIPIKSK